MTRPKNRSGRAVVTTHLEPEIGREVERLAIERGVSRSAAVAALVGEALLAPIEHQHGALIEAAIDRAVGQRLARLEDLASRTARESYRARWLVATLTEFLGDRMPAAPSEAAQRRAHQLNSESHRKARSWLGEDGWADPS